MSELKPGDKVVVLTEVLYVHDDDIEVPGRTTSTSLVPMDSVKPDPTPILEALIGLMKVEGEHGTTECAGCGTTQGVELGGVRYPDHQKGCPLVKAKAWLEGR